ncbi:hypothetical protein CRYUN_Cryun39dG0003600 [Craigia yunnanensis]
MLLSGKITDRRELVYARMLVLLYGSDGERQERYLICGTQTEESFRHPNLTRNLNKDISNDHSYTLGPAIESPSDTLIEKINGFESFVFEVTIVVLVMHGLHVNFMHVDRPGWRLSWKWQGDEVIWWVRGAEPTEQGNCSRITGKRLPLSCEKEPVIIDLMPEAPYNSRFANCCKGGVLSSIAQDPSKYGAAFQMTVGVSSDNSADKHVIPGNFSLGLPGYTCGDPFVVAPSKFQTDYSHRHKQALRTWNIACSYSGFLASSTPICCLSMSAFYNERIVQCPLCSCGFQAQANCVKSGAKPSLLQQLGDDQQRLPPVLRCSSHMCPIQVHWRVKKSYKGYWRVKITVTNLNYIQNYSNRNLVVLHPNLKRITRIFSFNYKPLNYYGNINDAGIFWGIQHYNDKLLQSGKNGNVQTELLLQKDPGIFTFREGWAFPRRISFNGGECVMPPPDEFLVLLNKSQSDAPSWLSILFLSLILLAIMF